MKFLLFLVAVFFVAVDALKCPQEMWGCTRKKSQSSKHRHSKLRLRVQRDDSWPEVEESLPENYVPCLIDDEECRARIQELWERAREQTMDDEKKEKRQLDCPFGVWGCKKRRVTAKEKPEKRNCAPGDRECRRDNRDMNDLIEELFTES
jgi:hypothetical protein